MSGEMDASAAGVDFRLIDPPRVAPKPVSPNRLLLLPLTLLLALVAGLFVPFAASQIQPVYFDVRSLREATGLPLLGTISRKANEVAIQMEKMDFRRFMIGFASLIGVYGVGIALLFIFTFNTA